MFAFLSSSKLKENLTELHIIVRTTGYDIIHSALLGREGKYPKETALKHELLLQMNADLYFVGTALSACL